VYKLSNVVKYNRVKVQKRSVAQVFMIISVDFLAYEDPQYFHLSQILSTDDFIIFVFLSLVLTLLYLACENSRFFRLLCHGGVLRYRQKNRENYK